MEENPGEDISLNYMEVVHDQESIVWHRNVHGATQNNSR